MQKVINQNRTPACTYCKYGREAPIGDEILCIKQGIMRPSSSCKKFKYDILKRKPAPAPKLKADHRPEEFQL